MALSWAPGGGTISRLEGKRLAARYESFIFAESFHVLTPVFMKNPFLLLSLAAVALLTSCGKRSAVEYIPFQEREDGRWGLVGTDGKVLFSEEFDRMPTMATGGHFVVQTKDGRYEIYKAEEKPTTVGGRYVDAGYYGDGLIPVAEEGQHVKYLDADGNEAFTLSKVDGKEVEGASVFADGRARFLAGGYYGAVDTKGNVAIRPEYIFLHNRGEGKFLGLSKRYEQAWRDDAYEKLTFSILDADGKELATVSGKEAYRFGYAFVDGALPAGRERDGKEEWGLLDEKGQWLLEPSRRCRGIGSQQGDLFTFYDGDKWGLMNRKGEVIIRAKYDNLFFADEGILMVCDEAHDDDLPWYFIDTDDNRLGRDSYKDLLPFYDGKHAFAQYSGRSWILIDKKGERAECEADIYDLAYYTFGHNWVESDYVDADAVVAALGISEQGAGAYRIGMTAPQAIEATRKGGGTPGDKPEDYRYDSDLGYEQRQGKLTATYRTFFPDDIAEPVTETRRESFGFYYFDHEVVTGYRFRTQTTTVVSVGLDLSGERMARHAPKLLEALKKKVRPMGRVVKENSGALLVRGKQNTLLAALDGAGLLLAVMAGDASAMDISKYATDDDDVAEADDALLTDSAAVYEPAAVIDSVAVDDSAAVIY